MSGNALSFQLLYSYNPKAIYTLCSGHVKFIYKRENEWRIALNMCKNGAIYGDFEGFIERGRVNYKSRNTR